MMSSLMEVFSQVDSVPDGESMSMHIEDEEMSQSQRSEYHSLNPLALDARSAPTVMQQPYDATDISYGMRSAATSIIQEPVQMGEERKPEDILLMDQEGVEEIPADFEWAHTFNQDLVQGVNKQIELVENTLRMVKAKRADLEKELFQPYTGKGKGGRKKMLKVPSLVFMPPYFKDTSGMAPPRNSDSQRKVDNGEFDPLTQPPKRWSPQDIKNLKECIRKDIVSSKKRPLENKIELLTEKRAKVDAETLEQMDDKILVLQRDIRRIDRVHEDTLFAEHKKANIDWLRIANNDFRGSRSARECRLKWENDLCPDWNHEKWTDKECANLKSLIENGSCKNWTKIAKDLGTNRTPYQCFEKYQSALNVSHLNREWTPEEDAQLKEIVKEVEIGNYICWEQVSYYMEGRTKSQCMFRFQRSLQSAVKRGRWTEDEDLLLLLAVNKIGAKEWSKIASMVQGRTDAQCRERWNSCLDHKVKVGDWCKEEDELLLFLVDLFGMGEWARVRRILPNRSSDNCKSRYRQLTRKNRIQKTVHTGVAWEKDGQVIPWKHVPLDDSEVRKMNNRGNYTTRVKQGVRKKFTDLVGLEPEEAIGTDSKVEEFDADAGVYDFLNSLPHHVQGTISRKLAMIKFKNVTSKRVRNSGSRTGRHMAENGMNWTLEDVEVWDHVKELRASDCSKEQLNLRETLRSLKGSQKADFHGGSQIFKAKATREALTSFYTNYIRALSLGDSDTLPPSIATCKLMVQLLRNNNKMYKSACEMAHIPQTIGSVKKRLKNMTPVISDEEIEEAQLPPKKRGRRSSRKSSQIEFKDEKVPLTPVFKNGIQIGFKNEALRFMTHCKANNVEFLGSKIPEPDGSFITPVMMKKIRAEPEFQELKDLVRSFVAWPSLMSDIPVQLPSHDH